MSIKMPPIEKIHEAYGAIVDDRITLMEGKAEVVSSDLSKKYVITWKDDIYTSNDNSSYWSGYPGYPILAVLMLQGRLSLDREIAEYFKGIQWKKRNVEHKNKYAEVVKEIMDEFAAAGIDCEKIQAEIDKVYKEIEQLMITVKRGSLRPPK